ncbi:hypothetical protein PVT67_11420 [Gallaecimonas kandeliae]|uniref:hypothetical protein n=1 Tax=Gallaecimonas kandeliae TaxID=3029055 RepID=UPI002647FB0D|nr:hypothetical protein [Gallaecimonas kandeliae]WKE64290.1 hypothetical protein PVT67_11420 [Gallaecimonas kandeliae]
MLNKWLVRFLTLLLLVLFYEQFLVLAITLVGWLLTKMPLDWFWDNQGQPFSLLLVALLLQPVGALFGYLVVRFEKQMPLFMALLVAIPRPVLFLWPDWAAQHSLLGYLLEPAVELVTLPLWTWLWLRWKRHKDAFKA